MNSKSIIWICMIIGSSAGGYIPMLWGSNYFSSSSILCTAIGGLFGIWLGFRISNY